MTYSQYKREIAIRILRRLAVLHHDSSPDYVTRVDEVMKGLDDFLPKDESDKRGTTEFTDLVPVYKVACPDCGNHGFDDEHQEYTDIHPFCGNCGYCFN
jgi:ribosomal protein S27AE